MKQDNNFKNCYKCKKEIPKEWVMCNSCSTEELNNRMKEKDRDDN